MLVKFFNFAFVLIFLASLSGFAQKKTKFGSVSDEEMQMISYDKDPSAPAVVLYSLGRTKVEVTREGNVVLTYDYHFRYKVLKKAGTEYAEQKYFYRTKGEDIKIKGYVYNLEKGKIVKTSLGDEHIVDEKINNYISAKKIVFPGVKEGTVFEYAVYHRSSSYIYPETWYFQSSIPVVFSELIFEQPTEVIGYKNVFFGYEKLASEEKNNFKEQFSFYTKPDIKSTFSDNMKQELVNIEVDATRFKWTAKDLPAIGKEEAFVPNFQNYTTRMTFSLEYTRFDGRHPKYFNDSWESVTKRMREYEDFGGYLKANSEVKAISALFANINNPVERVEAIRKHINGLVKFNGKFSEFSSGGSPKKVIEKKTGNIADINLLFTAVVRETGIKAHPAIMSTRSSGKLLPHIPQTDLVNYVFCAFQNDGKWIYADAVDEHIPTGFLPTRCLNEKAWLIDEGEGQWLTIPQGKQNSSVMFDLQLSEDGTAQITAKAGYSGYSAIEFMENKSGFLQSIRSVTERFFNGAKPEVVKDFEVKATENGYQIEFAMKGKYTLEDISYLPGLEIIGVSKNPFETEKRNFPVDMPFLYNMTTVINLRIPESYDFDEIPQATILNLGNNDGKYSFMVNKNGKVLQMMGKLQLNKAFFEPKEYENLRNFYSGVVKKRSEQVVLKKAVK